MNLLARCAALAIGEAIGLSIGNAVFLWPFFLGAGIVAVLWSYGAGCRFTSLLAFACLGLTLAAASQVAKEVDYRTRFWMRNRPNEQARTGAGGRSVCPALRAELSRRVGIGLARAPETADLNRAILLGERNRLPRATRQAFVDAGTMHVFAISGLHVMLVARVIVYLLVLTMVPYRFAGAAALPVLWTYVFVIGAPPSAVRAAAMASFYFAAPLFFRRPHALVAWSLTFLLVHILAPEQLFNVGSALSFAVMLGILLFLHAVRDAKGGVWTGLGVTLAAWAASVPIAAHVFGRMTPGGILANLVVLPVAGVSVTAGVLGVGASFVSRTLAAHFNNLAALFTEVMVSVSKLVARLPGSSFDVSAWSFATGVLWYLAGVLFLTLIIRVIRRRSSFLDEATPSRPFVSCS